MKNLSERPKADASDLELPDWSGMVDSSQSIDVATAFRMVEELYHWLPNKEYWIKRRAEERCDVEFTL